MRNSETPKTSAREGPTGTHPRVQQTAAGDGPSRRPANRIIVAVDGSPASIDALRWAAQQAELTGATIDAVTCWEIPIGFGVDFPLPDTNWAANARTVLHSSIKQAHPRFPRPAR